MGSGYISGRDPGDESNAGLKDCGCEADGYICLHSVMVDVHSVMADGPGFWEPGFPGVPRGTSQPHLNIPSFYPEVAENQLRQCARCNNNGCCHCQGD